MRLITACSSSFFVFFSEVYSVASKVGLTGKVRKKVSGVRS